MTSHRHGQINAALRDPSTSLASVDHYITECREALAPRVALRNELSGRILHPQPASA
jgi:hypothetical protein